MSDLILNIHPNILIIVEGVEAYPKEGYSYKSLNELDYYNTWWGGNLRGVRDYPIQTKIPGKVVYSPHDYGPSIFKQSWFYEGFNRDTLYEDVWKDNWFYIVEEKIAPVLIGEWGGFLDGGENQKNGLYLR